MVRFLLLLSLLTQTVLTADPTDNLIFALGGGVALSLFIPDPKGDPDYDVHVFTFSSADPRSAKGWLNSRLDKLSVDMARLGRTLTSGATAVAAYESLANFERFPKNWRLIVPFAVTPILYHVTRQFSSHRRYDVLLADGEKRKLPYLEAAPSWWHHLFKRNPSLVQNLRESNRVRGELAGEKGILPIPPRRRVFALKHKGETHFVTPNFEAIGQDSDYLHPNLSNVPLGAAAINPGAYFELLEFSVLNQRWEKKALPDFSNEGGRYQQIKRAFLENDFTRGLVVELLRVKPNWITSKTFLEELLTKKENRTPKLTSARRAAAAILFTESAQGPRPLPSPLVFDGAFQDPDPFVRMMALEPARRIDLDLAWRLTLFEQGAADESVEVRERALAISAEFDCRRTLQETVSVTAN